MSQKRKLDSENSKALEYLKKHHNYETFKIEEFLDILNCNTAQEALVEFELKLQSLLSMPYLSNQVRNFIQTLSGKKMDFMNSNEANIYWISKENAAQMVLNTGRQVSLYNKTFSRTISAAETVS